MKKPAQNKHGLSDYAYKKYVERYDRNAPVNIEKAKKEKAASRKEWWARNWIAFSSMLISIIAVVIALLK